MTFWKKSVLKYLIFRQYVCRILTCFLFDNDTLFDRLFCFSDLPCICFQLKVRQFIHFDVLACDLL